MQHYQLQLEDVSLAAPIGSSFLLQMISFTLHKGDRLAIIGASGAGKTTLLGLLNRLQDPTSGIITFNGQGIKEIPVLQLRRQVVLVPQEPKLLGMMVGDALAYPLKLQGLPAAEIEGRIKTWCDGLSIPSDWRDRTELQLSLGQRQLVAIARALVMQPSILLLDEPTSALDVGTAYRLISTLKTLAQERQTTIVMVNHQLELAQQLGERVLLLKEGQILAEQQGENIDWPQFRQILQQPKSSDDFDELF